MKTLKDLKEAIARIQGIDQEGFDSDWVLRKFARDQALINIELIKPYTNEYDLIVEFLVAGKDDDAAASDVAADAAVAAAVASADAAYAAYDADTADAAFDAIAAIDAADAAFDAIAAIDAADAAFDAIAAIDAADYTNAIASLNTLAKQHKLKDKGSINYE